MKKSDTYMKKYDKKDLGTVFVLMGNTLHP